MHVGIVILAAGSSSRMNRSKQLLEIEGESLLLRSVRIAHQSKAKKVVVVLGANEEDHRKLIDKLPVEIVSNPEWQKGMGNSLKKGLYHILKIFPDMESVVVMVCDQPLLTTKHLNHLLENSLSTENSIVASFYSGIGGVPALFKKEYFDQLLSLDDHEGAKIIIQKNKSGLKLVEFPDGKIDLDTQSDYETFLKNIT